MGTRISELPEDLTANDLDVFPVVDESSDVTKKVKISTLTTAVLDAGSANGQGVPAGGTDGQVLTKTSGVDYATAWEDPTSNLVTGPASATDNAIARFDSTTGKLVQNSNAVVDDNANLTLSVPTGVQVTKGGLNLTHTNGTGTSQYRISQDDYDLLQIKRTGDTTGDGAVWSLIDLQSPTVASDTEDSESTMSLTTRSGTPTSVARTLDIYNDEYNRDNGMGLRQLYKNTTPNPIRFESHDKTTSNGAWTMTGVSVTSGSPNGSYTSTSGVTPAAEDWIWDNAGTYFADDTKILSIDTGAKTFVLNRNATATSGSVSARGKNIRESLRITPDRQLLVRKHIADSGSTVAEFGGDVAVDGDITSGGIAVPTISSTDTLTNKTLTAPKFANAGFIADADGNEQLQFNASASAVNHIAIQNGATGLAPSISAVGDDANITLYVKGKGTGSMVIADGNSAQIIEGTGVTSAVNYTVISNSATGNAVSQTATGSDTNISINMVPKGTGRLQSGGVTVPTISSTDTLTNKRVTKRVGTTTSSATPTINTDDVDMYTLTAQAVDITSFTTNLSGTPTDGQTLWIAITGTAARAITWGTSFEASTVALPTTTVTTNRLDVGFVWNSATSKWRCIASA